MNNVNIMPACHKIISDDDLPIYVFEEPSDATYAYNGMKIDERNVNYDDWDIDIMVRIIDNALAFCFTPRDRNMYCNLLYSPEGTVIPYACVPISVVTKIDVSKEKSILAMVNSGDYTLREALVISTNE